MWNRIIEWFGDFKERRKLINEFNTLSRRAFVNGEAETLLHASITKGNFNYKHSFSKFLAAGFRIKALSGRELLKSEMNFIGNIIIENEILVRKLISLGWDTLEVHDNIGKTGLQWQLENHAKIGGMLYE